MGNQPFLQWTEPFSSEGREALSWDVRGFHHQPPNFAPFCFIRADEQEQLTSNSTQNGTQNGNQNRTLDLDFYLGIYGGEQLGLSTHYPVKSVSQCAGSHQGAASVTQVSLD